MLTEEEADLRNVFVAHVLIIVVLVVTLVANAKEGKDTSDMQQPLELINALGCHHLTRQGHRSTKWRKVCEFCVTASSIALLPEVGKCRLFASANSVCASDYCDARNDLFA